METMDYIDTVRFEMSTPAGELAVRKLMKKVRRKIQGRNRIKHNELLAYIQHERIKIAKDHPEVFDSEPNNHILEMVNKYLEMDYYARIESLHN